MTAFVLKDGNNITEEGISIPVLMVRVGYMVIEGKELIHEGIQK